VGFFAGAEGVEGDLDRREPGHVADQSTAFVPRAQMDLKVPSRIEREDVIAYLKTLKAKQ
jgi:hypothetical protein